MSTSPDASHAMYDPRGRVNPPSKVLHVRNLPLDVNESDIRTLCMEFGPIVKCKLHVGPARNQGFIEFHDVETARMMIEHHELVGEPPKLKGKALYLQYSTRTEVTNSSPPPVRPSNVLLVTFDNWKTDTPPSLDFVHLMFNPFGTVYKVALFEKAGYYQALVQYPDLRSAREALEVMNGHQLPRYMLPAGCNSCALRVEYSEHRDLVIKHQSDRFRDFTNPGLPPFDSQVLASGQPAHPVPPHPNSAPHASSAPPSNGDSSNVLHCMIDNVRFPVTVDSLYRVFGQCGVVQKVAIFEKNDNWQALIQFSDPMAAGTAKATLDGQSIYGNGLHTLRITFSLHKDLYIKANSERSWDYTQPTPSMATTVSSLSSIPSLSLPSDLQARSSRAAGPGFPVTSHDYEKAHEDVVRLMVAALQQQSGGGKGQRGGVLSQNPNQSFGLGNSSIVDPQRTMAILNDKPWHAPTYSTNVHATQPSVSLSSLGLPAGYTMNGSAPQSLYPGYSSAGMSAAATDLTGLQAGLLPVYNSSIAPSRAPSGYAQQVPTVPSNPPWLFG